LVAIRGELSAKIEAVESKIGAVETRLDSKIDAVEARLESKINMVDSKINVVDSKIDVVKSEMRSGFSGLGAALENAVFRGELSTTREIADLRIRVERLERERGQLPQ
jgi:predicted  nucleic acid-binding Zn-ribbon protein